MSLKFVTASLVKKLILLFGGYRVVGAFNDLTTQTHSTTDSTKNVTLGAGGTTPDGVVNVGSDGVITILRSIPWFSKFRVRITRQGASQTSKIFFQVFRSTDGGASWSFFGTSADVELDNSRQVEIFIDPSFLIDPVGTKYKVLWARSSDGHNSGDLTAGTPSTALSNAGFQIAPSAQLTVFTLAGSI